MPLPSATPDVTLADLRSQTLRRLAALAWLADIAEAIVSLLRHWLALSATPPRGAPRLRHMLDRVRHSARVIAALEARLRESLRLIEAGVRPPAEAASRAEPAEIETPERPEAADWRERPERPERSERPERFFSAAVPPRLKGSVDEIVAGIIDDLGGLPAWRRLAEAVWAGEDPAPSEVGRILAEALIEAMPLRRPAPANGRAALPAVETPRPASGPPLGAPARAPAPA